jgi:hypothetical protein
MNFESTSHTQLNALEHQVRDLLVALKKAKIENKPLTEALQSFEQMLGADRRERFDAVNSEYKSY